MAELKVAVDVAARGCRADLGGASGHCRAATDALQRLRAADTAEQTEAELEVIAQELWALRMGLISAQAKLGRIEVEVGAAKLCGEMERPEPLPLERWRMDGPALRAADGRDWAMRAANDGLD